MPDRDRQPDDRRPPDELSEEELQAERGGPLPDREALSVLSADVAIPADPAIAADVLSGEGAGEAIGEEPPPEEEQPPDDEPAAGR